MYEAELNAAHTHEHTGFVRSGPHLMIWVILVIRWSDCRLWVHVGAEVLLTHIDPDISRGLVDGVYFVSRQAQIVKYEIFILPDLHQIFVIKHDSFCVEFLVLSYIKAKQFWAWYIAMLHPQLSNLIGMMVSQ